MHSGEVHEGAPLSCGRASRASAPSGHPNAPQQFFGCRVRDQRSTLIQATKPVARAEQLQMPLAKKATIAFASEDRKLAARRSSGGAE